MSPAIDISVEEPAWSAAGDVEALARAAVDAALAASGDELTDESELSIVLCNDAFIAALNEKWRGLAKPTNVLSFPVDMDSPALGDIVIAYETVAREALEDGKTLRDHLSHMIVHGFCHLLGFDHETDEEAEAMEAMEARALAALGIASPFENADLVAKPQAAEDRRPTP
ncbi:rRNA maturation RNase YbeY [Beijerinckia sp. L45]|uniref:rRNA maturation RNase YbeY n=1 Tax=Beijerinckia sp. L45 TaxID=1641855 RepID=UPI00131B1C31|nr:rRNA maturation RNase YbeY [Beijerinckia sp. L45]